MHPGTKFEGHALRGSGTRGEGEESKSKKISLEKSKKSNSIKCIISKPSKFWPANSRS